MGIVVGNQQGRLAWVLQQVISKVGKHVIAVSNQHGR